MCRRREHSANLSLILENGPPTKTACREFGARASYPARRSFRQQRFRKFCRGLTGGGRHGQPALAARSAVQSAFQGEARLSAHELSERSIREVKLRRDRQTSAKVAPATRGSHENVPSSLLHLSGVWRDVPDGLHVCTSTIVIHERLVRAADFTHAQPFGIGTGLVEPSHGESQTGQSEVHGAR